MAAPGDGERQQSLTPERWTLRRPSVKSEDAMTPERWQREEELFAEALERPPAERPAFLKRECAGDDALRAELESLLSDGGKAWRAALPALLRAELASFLAKGHALGDPSISPATSGRGSCTASDGTVSMKVEPGSVSGVPAGILPAAIGHYRIIGFIGEGGMAVVYKAEQEQPRRVVALKVVKPGLASPEYQRRWSGPGVKRRKFQIDPLPTTA